jgi:hypothetical protein
VLDAANAAQDAGIAAVAAGERELGEQLGDALVENRAVHDKLCGLRPRVPIRAGEGADRQVSAPRLRRWSNVTPRGQAKNNCARLRPETDSSLLRQTRC